MLFLSDHLLFLSYHSAVCVLPFCCLCPTVLLFLSYRSAVFDLPFCCLCPTVLLFVSYRSAVCVLPFCCLCPAVLLFLSYRSAVCVLPFCCFCPTVLLFLSYHCADHGSTGTLYSLCTKPEPYMGIITVFEDCPLQSAFRAMFYIRKWMRLFFLTFLLVFHLEMTVRRNKFPYNKPNRCTNIQLYSGKKLHVSGSFSAHHKELFTEHSALAHVIRVWRQLACRIRMELHPDPARKLSSNPYNMPVPNVQWITPDGRRNCQKHVEFHTGMKLEISA